MMQLDGAWYVDEHTATQGGEVTDINQTDRVWFNATKDVGGYCEGTWYLKASDNDEFLWGIDDQGTEFKINNDAYDEIWTEEKKEREVFIIERHVDDTKFRMEMSR